MSDTQWMQQAIAQARLGEGLTRPNPPVGAVVVREGVLLGAGYHAQAGGSHAEVAALAHVPNASGATIYVTLEPCSTQGRTPPCTKAILNAGIKRVVIGSVDPNPDHAGRGLDLLRDAGLEVVAGICDAETDRLIDPFRMHQLAGRPFVTLKMACSLDGRIADAAGGSKWITGEAARESVQVLRRRVDAIWVGGNTVIADDPGLLPRPAEGREPFRVVADPRGTLPRDRKVFTDALSARTLVYGAESLQEILRDLAAKDVMHVLCEGGGKLAGALLQAGLVDECHMYYAPIWLGPEAKPVQTGVSPAIGDVQRWKTLSVDRLGEDTRIVLRP